MWVPILKNEILVKLHLNNRFQFTELSCSQMGARRQGDAPVSAERRIIMADYTHVVHGFDPVYDEKSKILILGSFPSVISRAENFFYGNKRNRFWRVMAEVLSEPAPDTVDAKKNLLIKHNIALWDVLAECDIIGSADSTIRNPVPADITRILNCADIKKIICNGNTSYSLFMRYLRPVCGIEPVKLPSTSPANAGSSFEKLVEEWSKEISTV